TLGFVEKETCLIIAFIGIKNSSKDLKKSSIFSCFFHKNRRKSVKFFFAAQIFSLIFAYFSLQISGKVFAASAFIPKINPKNHHYKQDMTSKTYYKSSYVSIYRR
ncbi:MAG: hypothetical protein ACM690_03450, partial [Phascolarctobacterium sp.]|uniref:hypothetical protein n=1 Tax=Phascolarctobacterium sp. TaxID=2049039 RepID=UPI003A10222F